MVMEKGDCDLNKILQGFTTNLPLYNLMNILYQMLQAVNYIHQNNVIHSDLKPANFLMVNGRLKLIDFGIASNMAVDSTSIIKFSQAGTFNYISPEALTDISSGTSPMRGGNQPKIKISTKSDVWSLGCILYLLLYQKTPFGHIRNINAKMNAIANPGSSIEYPALPIYYPQMLAHVSISSWTTVRFAITIISLPSADGQELPTAEPEEASLMRWAAAVSIPYGYSTTKFTVGTQALSTK